MNLIIYIFDSFFSDMRGWQHSWFWFRLLTRLRSGLGGRWLCGQQSWDRCNIGIRWRNHEWRIGASWIRCWVGVWLWCGTGVGIRIRIRIGIRVWSNIWCGVWCGVGAGDTASYSGRLVRIGLITLWDLATFGIIGIRDHDTSWCNVRILSTSKTT